MNSPIPSLLLPLWQNESLSKIIDMKICDLPWENVHNAFPFNGLKRLLVVCLLLKWFRKLLEALESPLEFSP